MAGNKTRKTSKGMTWRGFYAMLRSLTFIHLVMGISSDLDKFYEQDAHILNPGSGLLFIFLKLKKSPGDSIWNQKGEPFEPWNSGNPPWILNDRKSQGALDTASFIHSFSYSFVYLIIQSFSERCIQVCEDLGSKEWDKNLSFSEDSSLVQNTHTYTGC